MEMLAARAPETIDFGEGSSKSPREDDVPLSKLDAENLREKAIAARKEKEGKADESTSNKKLLSSEALQQYVDDLVVYVTWTAEQGDMMFEWDCSALERHIIQQIAEKFKVDHGERMWVVTTPHSIKINWSGNYEA